MAAIRSVATWASVEGADIVDAAAGVATSSDAGRADDGTDGTSTDVCGAVVTAGSAAAGVAAAGFGGTWPACDARAEWAMVGRDVEPDTLAPAPGVTTKP